MQEQTLIEKIRRLPPEKIAEIEDFVDFLAQRTGRHTLLPEGEIRNDKPNILPPTITDPAERAEVLRDVAQRMKENSFTGNPPRFTREELHERR